MSILEVKNLKKNLQKSTKAIHENDESTSF